jgi:hypothetical protein
VYRIPNRSAGDARNGREIQIIPLGMDGYYREKHIGWPVKSSTKSSHT